MKKIPTLYQRDPDDRRFVTTDVTPGCEWVLAGEGTPTRKFDGTCTMRDDAGRWWARREVKPGKTPPTGWRQVDRERDEARAEVERLRAGIEALTYVLGPGLPRGRRTDRRVWDATRSASEMAHDLLNPTEGETDE